MDFPSYFPIFDKLEKSEQDQLLQSVSKRKISKGSVIYRGDESCLGLIIVTSGQLRAYITSDEGREITLYRLLEHDVCLFSASCMMQNIQFEIMLLAERDTEFWLIPTEVYGKLSRTSINISNYTNELMSSKMTDVMWLMEQIMWKSMDKRLAAFLLEEAALEETNCLSVTHEKIASHLGTAREVVTRMLKYLQSENMVHLSRGTVELIDEERLQQLGL